MTTQPLFFFRQKSASPQIRGLLFHNCQIVHNINNLRTKLITSREIDFRCDLTTNSFFTKWGVENNPEQAQKSVIK